MKCAQITPETFVGPCPHDPDDFDSLKAKSVTAILNLLAEEDADELEMTHEQTHAIAADLAFRKCTSNRLR